MGNIYPKIIDKIWEVLPVNRLYPDNIIVLLLKTKRAIANLTENQNTMFFL